MAPTFRIWSASVTAVVYLGVLATEMVAGGGMERRDGTMTRADGAETGAPAQGLERRGDLTARDSRWPMLLVDTALIAGNEGVSLTVCEAVKYSGNPVIRLGGAGSVDEVRAQLTGSVLYHDGRFRMWYWSVPGGPAYAESADGLRWTKPNLGLVRFRGSTANNLIAVPGGLLCPIHFDPEDKVRPYKMAVPKPNPHAGSRHSLWSWAWSKDGFRWNVVPRPTPSKWLDAEQQVLTRVGAQWVIYAQGLDSRGRVVMASRSSSLDVPIWKWDRSPVWSLTDKYRLYQSHGGMAPWPRPGLTLGVFGIFLDRHELADTRVDLGLVLSRDGFNWREPWPLATILRRGNAGEWDSTFLLQSSPGFVNVRDKTYMYYSGTDTGNEGENMQIGVAMLRRDGFGFQGIDIGWSYARRRGPRTGGFVTVPIRLHDKTRERVLLNVANVNRDDRNVQVELLDRAGKPIPGFSLADADRIAVPGIAVPASWRRDTSLAGLPGDVIRLRVRLHGGRKRLESPRVYAIYFNPPEPIR
ncbi:MAG: hypothetical protein GXP31_00340 [Kiritimatiellaeota bacterium]|nr:hypothetical protein [Kiritimatiellota bacterium]